MATPVEIKIYQIAKTQVNREAVERWLREGVGVSDEYELPAEGTVTDPALLIALAAKNCYQSFEPGLNKNVTKVRQDLTEYFDNILASGHGSVLEHATYSYAIVGCTRIFTAEQNRHRAGWAISEQSLRYVRFEEIPYWFPDSLKIRDSDDEDIRHRKTATASVMQRAFSSQEILYQEMEKIWDIDNSSHNFHYKKTMTSLFRRIVGLGVATSGVWTGNIRALRHVLAMRTSAAAEEEILHVFSRIAADISKEEPMLFGDFYQDENGFWRPKYLKV